MKFIYHQAWIGTGACDPDKDLKEMIITVSVLAGWGMVIFLLYKLAKSPANKLIKIVVSILVILISVASSLWIYAMTLLNLACSG